MSFSVSQQHVVVAGGGRSGLAAVDLLVSKGARVTLSDLREPEGAADLRRRGVGRALVRAAEEWARGQGLREVASDALLDNVASHRAHEGLGFTEVERAVRYRKSL